MRAALISALLLAVTPLPADVPGLIAHMARDDYAGQAACDQLVKTGKSVVPELLPALQHTMPRVRYWAAAALCRLADERAYQPLLTALREDKHPIVRATILWQLQHFNKPEQFDLAVQHLADPDPFVRGWALKVLDHGQRREQLPAIRGLTQDKDAGVRHDALVAVVKLGGNAELPLIQKLATDDTDPQVRAGALRCLTLLPEKKAEILAVMIRCLSDPHTDVQAAAAQLLAKGANQSFGFDPARPARERERAAAQWQKWYEQNQTRLRWDNAKRRFVLPDEP